jgi:hypothetical protein
MTMIEVHLAFPEEDDLPVAQFPGVPRIGDRVFSKERGGFWRVADVGWNTENGTVLLDLKPDVDA